MTSALMATEVFGKGADRVRPARHVPGRRLADRGAAGRPPRARPPPAGRRRRPGLRRRSRSLAGLMPTYLTFALLTPLHRAHRADDDHQRQHLHAAPHRRRDARPGDGALHDDLHGRHARSGRPIIGWIGETFGARWTLLVGGLLTIAGRLASRGAVPARQGASRRALERSVPAGRPSRRARRGVLTRPSARVASILVSGTTRPMRMPGRPLAQSARQGTAGQQRTDPPQHTRVRHSAGP